MNLNSQVNKYPWLVRLWFKEPDPDAWQNVGICGGVLIASKFVLTAAHCTRYVNGTYTNRKLWKIYQAEELYVTIGDHNIRETEAMTISIDVEKIERHPDFKMLFANFGHDIAILTLKEEVNLQQFSPACMALATDGGRFIGKTITAVGWGVQGWDDWSPVLDEPNEVKLTVTPDAFCTWSPGLPSIMCLGLDDPVGRTSKVNSTQCQHLLY